MEYFIDGLSTGLYEVYETLTMYAQFSMYVYAHFSKVRTHEFSPKASEPLD